MSHFKKNEEADIMRFAKTIDCTKNLKLAEYLMKLEKQIDALSSIGAGNKRMTRTGEAETKPTGGTE